MGCQGEEICLSAGIRQPGRDRLLACQELLGNMVWREWLLQDQARNRTLWSWLTSLHLCLLCCLKHPTSLFLTMNQNQKWHIQQNFCLKMENLDICYSAHSKY